MAAPIIAAGIAAGAALLQGMMGQAAARKREQQAIIARGQQQAFQTQARAIESGQRSQADAMKQLVGTFRNALVS